MGEYKESVSGFKQTGTWDEIVAHGEKVEQALSNLIEEDGFEKDLGEFDAWRPKISDQLSDEMSEKTAKQASIDKNGDDGASPSDEVKEAKNKLKGTSDDQTSGEAIKNVAHSFLLIASALNTLARRSIRESEEIVYEDIMPVLSPYYFDNQLISANIKKVDEEKYEMEVNVSDDEIKRKLSERLEKYDSAENWRIDADIETSRAETSEGIDVPDN